jgi:hypothetical protein
LRRTKAAASQVPVTDLIGPVTIVGGTPFCGVPNKLGATYGITARDGEALDEQRKFGGRVTIDQGRIYRADRGTTLLIFKTVSLGMSAPVMAFGGSRSLSSIGFLQPAWARARNDGAAPTNKKQTSIPSSTSVDGE